MLELLQQRLDRYQAKDPLQEEQALKEIMQEIALYALWQAGFFEVAAFQGGTSLRILHQLPRFSEDLDFLLKQPDPAFAWEKYLQPLLAVFELFGLRPEVLDKSRMDQAVRKALLKDDSIAGQLNLSFYAGLGNPARHLKIKLEVDVNPPAGSGFGYSYLDFPLDFEVCHQDLASNFALKIHALLCRPYLKGRDWYDFAWYVKQGVAPNLLHLQAALQQSGAWAGQGIVVDTAWLQATLTTKISTIDWKKAVSDVERFVPLWERPALQLWSERFFLQKLAHLPFTPYSASPPQSH